ncbi:unnamed protein product, partial [Laminaria digitata]
DPLEGIRVTALWRGLGGGRPLPHAPLELVGGPSAGGVAVDWNATVSWEVRQCCTQGSLGFKLRLLLAVYVQSLALGGDLLMADVGNTCNEARFFLCFIADVTSARERARHIGAVLGPGTRALIAQMRATTQHDQASSGGGGGGGDGDLPDPAEIVHSARYLLTPRRASLSYREATLGTSKSGRGPGFAYVMGGTGTDSGGSIGRTPPRGLEVDGADDGGATPWLWVPRGGAPACRLVSQVALEAARFGTHGVCLGDVAAFWKSFVQELRFLWEEGASVPRMVRTPP